MWWKQDESEWDDVNAKWNKMAYSAIKWIGLTGKATAECGVAKSKAKRGQLKPNENMRDQERKLSKIVFQWSILKSGEKKQNGIKRNRVK